MGDGNRVVPLAPLVKRAPLPHLPFLPRLPLLPALPHLLQLPKLGRLPHLPALPHLPPLPHFLQARGASGAREEVPNFAASPLDSVRSTLRISLRRLTMASQRCESRRFSRLGSFQRKTLPDGVRNWKERHASGTEAGICFCRRHWPQIRLTLFSSSCPMASLPSAELWAWRPPAEVYRSARSGAAGAISSGKRERNAWRKT